VTDFNAQHEGLQTPPF